MIILSVINWGILIIYTLVFLYFIYGFINSKENKNSQPPIAISVLIAFRNEEKNIEQLIKSFERLSYNLNIAEFIFINDHSTDNSYELLSNRLKNTNLIYKIINQEKNKQGKKQAIITGVNNAKNNWIVTIDTDSIPNKNWLTQFSTAFQENKEFVIAPVINHKSKSFIGNLQNIEAILLAGTSIGSASNKTPLISSGANLGYSKSLFYELNPYQNNLHIPSGDDLFFLDKAIEAKKIISYISSKEALVFTKGQSSYKEILSQAIRWSSKNKELKSKLNLYLSVLVFCTNLLVLINLIYFSFTALFSFYFLIIKFSVDFLFLAITANKYKQGYLILLSPFIFLLYPIHLLIIFVSSFFLSVKWKERAIINNEK